MNDPLPILSAYFDLIQSFNLNPEAYAAVLHPEVEQVEYPNLIYKTVQRRNFNDILDNIRVGRELLRDPNFAVERTALGADGSVTVEGLWQATVISDIGPLLRGQRLSAHLCLIFEFKDGKIYRQRRYPCFELV
ncbi:MULTISPECIES: nuclear transport factor 2 family protein [Hymenobacter]|uniref:SnoaL-like domain-containing protein n=1 Tax=Hymenobacter mucosus TaxID=1411120 RepID=A0A238WX71_9BACT|nr:MULTISPECIES: nuclear transport factor 2 family protein [Hymenobacter]SNR51137.1 hypothetical protein SAMN06269173_103225 [Hymenobacter mucosus]